MLVFPLIYSCSENNEIPLEKNVDGSELTEEFCINLVRSYWDCNRGAIYDWSNESGSYGRLHYGCNQGDEGSIMSDISYFFEKGIDVEKSYYKNYILHVHGKEFYRNYYVEVYF